VLKNGTGDYTITFTTAMPDANYAGMSYGDFQHGFIGASPTTTAFRIRTAVKNIGLSDAPNYADCPNAYVAIFR
jgi:hypothetical protein